MYACAGAALNVEWPKPRAGLARELGYRYPDDESAGSELAYTSKTVMASFSYFVRASRSLMLERCRFESWSSETCCRSW